MDDRPTAAVIGGGPAGLIAAEHLAREGVAVTVYDQGRSVGRKLLLAGRSGLNLTHTEPDTEFAKRYDDPAWAAELLGGFGPAELRAWSASLGQETFVGSSGRVFPEAFRAAPLLRAWLARLNDLGVEFLLRHRWCGWDDDGRHLIEGPDGVRSAIDADAVVLALGGASWPRTGSDGAWVEPIVAAGVDVQPLRASNAGVAVAWSETFASRFAGAPLKNVAVSLGDQPPVRGDAIVSLTGLEGGPVYGVGAAIRAELDRVARCVLHIDLHPDLTIERLQTRLAERRGKESMTTWLRRATGLHPVALNLLREVTANELPADADAIAMLIKQVPVQVESLMPIERAISTAGGISRTQLDDSLMLRSRPGTWVAGEMIDWDAPTGGYLLQLSFATGVRAARGALNSIAR